jgi:F0F1-type ATP synthase assembly protein I
VPKETDSPRQWAPYLNLGAVLAACVGIGVWIGHTLDERWGTEPWLLLVGSLFGVASGLYHFLKEVLKLGKRNGKH